MSTVNLNSAEAKAEIKKNENKIVLSSKIVSSQETSNQELDDDAADG